MDAPQHLSYVEFWNVSTYKKMPQQLCLVTVI